MQPRKVENELSKEGISVDGLNKADQYRAMIWNSVRDISDLKSLSLIANNALTLDYRENEATILQEPGQHPSEE
ncbi:MAG: hypothetical protein E7222_13075 [Clostridiales bacterium]|nr:hypothetical protein [Clostridiales bacterium]